MTAINGRLARMQIGNGGSPETFADIGGAVTDGFSKSNSPVEVGTKDDGNWVVHLDGAGQQSVTMNISGKFNDSASEALFEDAALAMDVKNFKFVKGNGDYYKGAFYITQYTLNAPNQQSLEYSATLISSGAVTLTRAA